MNHAKSLILLPILFIGCKPTTVYVDRPVEVKVAVPVPCPEPPVVRRPVIKPLPKDAKPEQIAESALKALAEMCGYADALEVALSAYRAKK